MLQIPAVYGIPKDLIEAISKLYEGTSGRFVPPNWETGYLELLAEVQQSDALALHIFVIVID